MSDPQYYSSSLLVRNDYFYNRECIHSVLGKFPGTYSWPVLDYLCIENFFRCRCQYWCKYSGSAIPYLVIFTTGEKKIFKKILCLYWLNSIGPIWRLRESSDPFLMYPYWKYRCIKICFLCGSAISCFLAYCWKIEKFFCLELVKFYWTYSASGRILGSIFNGPILGIPMYQKLFFVRYRHGNLSGESKVQY